jgi:hypothetical protein
MTWQSIFRHRLRRTEPVRPNGSSDAGAGCRIEHRYAALQSMMARFARTKKLVAIAPADFEPSVLVLPAYWL